MVAIPQTIFSNAFISNEDIFTSIKISLKFIPKDPINDKSSLVQMMVWHRAGDRSLSEPMMTWLIEAYACHSSTMN